MKNSTPDLQNPKAVSLFGPALASAVSGWILHGDLEGWTRRTIEDRRDWMRRMQAFLNARDMGFDVDGMRLFFHALTRGDAAAGCTRKLSPASVKHVHAIVKAFGGWCVREDLLAANPMLRIPAPILRDDGIDPFTDEEMARILHAAANGRHGLRDYALVMFLADTGARNSEVCALTVADVDLSARTALIRCGKGGKARTVAFGRETAQAIFKYLRKEIREDGEPLFMGERGEGFTRGALTHLLRRIGLRAGVKGVHPHRFRHDCAVRLLRNGAHVFGVQQLLGHSRISTTEIYVKIAENDLRSVMQTASPMDNLKVSRKRR